MRQQPVTRVGPEATGDRKAKATEDRGPETGLMAQPVIPLITADAEGAVTRAEGRPGIQSQALRNSTRFCISSADLVAISFSTRLICPPIEYCC